MQRYGIERIEQAVGDIAGESSCLTKLALVLYGIADQSVNLN